MKPINTINDFLLQQNIAIVGLSRNKKKFSYQVYQQLKKKHTIFPVNPEAEEIDSLKNHKKVSDLPDQVTAALIITPPKETEQVIQDCIQKGIKYLWIQQGSETTKAIELANNKTNSTVYNECIFMFAEPVSSIHAFHRWLNRLFGKYPK